MKPRLIPDFTADELRSMLDCDRVSGSFRRLSKGGKKRVGARTRGRLYIGIKGRKYAASHLAWFYVTGEWPTLEIDHKNCDPSDDSFDNLRPATRAQNLANMRNRPSNTSGLKGACWDKSHGKWIASISIGNRFKNLGRYDTREEAHAAYQQAAKEIRGEFARFE